MEIFIENSQKADTFVALFQNIRLFTEPINIIFEYNRMFVQAMDSTHVSIFEISLPSRWFHTYKPETEGNEQSVVIGVNASILSKILNTREKTQTIRILYNKDDEDKLFIHFASENKSIFDKHFEIPLLEIDTTIMNIPTIDYQAEFSIASVNFANIVNQLKLFGDTMEIHCSEDKIILYSNSAESGKMFVEINMDDLTEFSIEEGEKIEMSFSLNYLHKICSYHKLVKDMEIKISADSPMKVLYILEEPIGNKDSEGETHSEDVARMTFYLAPKMNEN
jgi:proliferating cell nuclear antigen PCNA